MASITGSIQLMRKNAAWFTSNATRVLLDGQVVFLSGSGETKYKVGDGVTQLSALPWNTDALAASSHSHSMSNISDYEENIDFASGAAVVGYSILTTNRCRYSRVGKIVTVTVEFLGTSNSTSLSFTLPYAPAFNQYLLNFMITNNGLTSNNPGLIILTNGVTTAQCYQNRATNAFTASGQKLIAGTFTYITV